MPRLYLTHSVPELLMAALQAECAVLSAWKVAQQYPDLLALFMGAQVVLFFCAMCFVFLFTMSGSDARRKEDESQRGETQGA